MKPEDKKYAETVVFPVIEPRVHATFSTMKGFKINSRFMVFACEKSLDTFYFMTKKNSEKVNELRKNSMATVSILSSGYGVSDFSETIITGDVRIIDDPEDKIYQKGIKLLKAKSQSLREMKKKVLTENFSVLTLVTKEITFRFYKDVLIDAPPTVIRF